MVNTTAVASRSPFFMISFIVPAHNEEQLLGRTLAALHAASAEIGRPYELIVVDDASTDRDGGNRARGRRARDRGRSSADCQHAKRGRPCRGRRPPDLRGRGHAGQRRTLRATVAAVERGAAGGGALLSFDGPLPMAVRVLAAALALGMRLWHLAAGAYLFCTRATRSTRSAASTRRSLPPRN